MRQSATPIDKPAARPRTSRILGLALILLTLALALPAAASASSSTGGWGGWAFQDPGSYGDLNGVAFADATHGWAVGATWDAATDTYKGAILATTNGGVTWSAQNAGTTRNLNAVTFSDADHGWAVGMTHDAATDTYKGAILATTNGGTTWTAQNPESTATLTAVAFSDASHGLAVGDGGAILATTDGGANWSTQTSGTTAELTGVAFPDATHGWAVSRTWVDVPIDATGYWGTILATTDGGATWSTQVSEVKADFAGVAFPDATHGWAIDFDGAIYATTSGGASWSHAYLENIDYHPTAVAFLDATHGWVVGEMETDHPGNDFLGALILATADGGATWRDQSVAAAPDEGVSAVAFSDATHGWVVGPYSTILATSTGGNNPLTLKLSGLKSGVVKLGKRVTAKGVVKLSSLVGRKVKLTTQKKGARWVTIKIVKRAIAAGGAYSWKYTPAQKGAYRMLATVVMSAKQGTAGTGWRGFKVK